MEIKGSRTESHLRDAFAKESQANRLFLYFAQKADAEGYSDIASVFRSTAEGETGHAHALLEYLEPCGDPASGLPFGCTGDNLRAAIAAEREDSDERYPMMARVAREEGFDEIADWFESLAGAEHSHAERFRAALERLDRPAAPPVGGLDP
jgi:rubrerythrin